MRALITGAGGFSGGWLAAHLAAAGHQVLGLDCNPDADMGAIAPSARFLVDSRDGDALAALLAEHRPDVVFHLAGLLRSADPREYYRANVEGTVSLCEALVRRPQPLRLVLVSSSAVYGAGQGGEPIGEEAAPAPVTHYGVSKLGQEAVAQRYWRAQALPVVCLRPFNLLGPGQSPAMALGGFADQIAAIEAGRRQPVVRVGNLSARRDFVDIRDAVAAYAAVAAGGRPGSTYNVCSGAAHAIGECLDILVSLARVPVQVAADPQRLQADDVPAQVGDGGLIARDVGWRPGVPLRQSLSDMLDHCRKRYQ